MSKLERASSVLTHFLLAVCLSGTPATGRAQGRWQLKILTTNHQMYLVWQFKQGRELIVQAPSFAIGGKGQTTKRSPLKVRLVSYQAQDEQAHFKYALSTIAHGVNRTGEYTVVDTVANTGEQAVLSQVTDLRFADPLTSDLTLSQTVRVTGKSAIECSLPLRDGVVKTFPLPAGIKRSGYFFSGYGSTSREGEELALPVVGLDFDYTPGGSFAIATDPYWGSQFEIRELKEGGQPGSSVTTSYTYTGSLVPVKEEKRTEAFVYHKEGVEGMLSSFYDTIPEIHPSPSWIQGIQLNYYDYISSYKSEPGQGWYHDVQKLADKIPLQDRGKVVLCLHGYYDYVGRYSYDDKAGRLVEKWNSYDEYARKIPMSLTEVHKRIRFAKDRGFHVLLLFGDGTAEDTSSPYYRNNWAIKDEKGNYPSRGFWEWRPGIKVKMPPGRQLPPNENPTNHIMDPAIPAVHDWFMRYTKALLKEYGREIDGFVWDEVSLIGRGWVSYARPQPSYSDCAMMHLVSDLTQEVQEWHKFNPDLVFLVAGTPYALVANGTYQDSECAPQMWAPGFLINYRNCLWSCLWWVVRLKDYNKFAVLTYGLPQGLSNGWGDDLGPSEMPDELLDQVIERFLARIRRGGDRTRYLLTTAPPITYNY